MLDNEKKGRLLDAPAGEGALCKKLKNKEFDVYACDIDPSQFKLKDIECMKVDLNEPLPLPYQSSSFDYITCVEGLEHIENPWNVIREFSRVLKKGGKLIITTPNVASL
ncbi:MAG: class I SAM-dependent methyltransferase, partial [ANME-2 cluster archaeon]|nr:class I SAM-dependent methyltransferase [ANME-2 cluster archaeon]